jgi:transposase
MREKWQKVKKTKKMIQEVEDLYYEKGWSLEEVAERFSVSVSVIKHILYTKLRGTRTRSEAAKAALKRNPHYNTSDAKIQKMQDAIQEKRETDPTFHERLSKTKRGEKNNRAKLTEETARSIRSDFDSRIKKKQTIASIKRELSQKYSMSESTIYSIGKRLTWKHL